MGKGCRCNREQKGNPHSILLHQVPFVADLETKKITMRGRDSPQLTKVEMSEYRSTVGCLQYLPGASPPDLAAGCSLLQSGNPEVHRLRGL